MEAHEADLRAEVSDSDQIRLIEDDYHRARLDPRTLTLLDFAVKLTLRPREMRKRDLDPLRQAGFTDENILDAVQMIAYFNFANRVMDALGIEPEPEMRHRRPPD